MFRDNPLTIPGLRIQQRMGCLRSVLYFISRSPAAYLLSGAAPRTGTEPFALRTDTTLLIHSFLLLRGAVMMVYRHTGIQLSFLH